jgi:riboflavin-specific deaminase-like protein
MIDHQFPADASLWDQILAVAAGRSSARPADDGAGAAFWRLYGPLATLAADRGFVIGQLGQSLDGRVATATGKSHYINCPEALNHLHRLRALVDAVIVGIGTVVADDPRLNVRHVRGPTPARVVIDPNGRLPPDARLLADDGADILVIQSADIPRPANVGIIRLPAPGGLIAPAAIVAALAARGYRRVLVEGGAWTVSAFLAAGMLDRLHLCIAPLVIGSGPVGLCLPPIDELTEAMRLRASVHRIGLDILFDCELDRRPVTAAAASALDLVEG